MFTSKAIPQCQSSTENRSPILMFDMFDFELNRDAFIISLMDTFTSLLAGFTIFAILGSLAVSSGIEVEDVVKSGPGLAFISYPDAIAKFDWVPQLFSVLFFLMLFTLGVGSATSLTSGLITIICDQWPDQKRWLVTLGVCIAGFLIGLVYVTPVRSSRIYFTVWCWIRYSNLILCREVNLCSRSWTTSEPTLWYTLWRRWKWLELHGSMDSTICEYFDRRHFRMSFTYFYVYFYSYIYFQLQWHRVHVEYQGGLVLEDLLGLHRPRWPHGNPLLLPHHLRASQTQWRRLPACRHW